MKPLFFPLLVLFSLSVSATPAEEIKQVDAKYLERLSDSRFNPIRNKFPIAPKEEATLPMLSDSSRVTSQQKKALEAYQAWGREYVKEIKELLQQYAPPQSDNISWRYQESMKLVADIYSGKVTWGDFNKQWSQIAPEYYRRVAATNELIQKQKIAAHNREIDVQNQQALVERNKKVQFCQSLIQAMQVNCRQSQPIYGGTPLSDLTNVMNNFDPAGAYECSSLRSRYNMSCQ